MTFVPEILDVRSAASAFERASLNSSCTGLSRFTDRPLPLQVGLSDLLQRAVGGRARRIARDQLQGNRAGRAPRSRDQRSEEVEVNVMSPFPKQSNSRG